MDEISRFRSLPNPRADAPDAYVRHSNGRTLLSVFYDRVRITDEIFRGAPCLRWQIKSADAPSYGVFSMGGRRQMSAHRWSYENFVGPLEADKQVDHLCRHPWCVQPSHLELVEMKENVRRMHVAHGRQTITPSRQMTRVDELEAQIAALIKDARSF